MAGTDPGAPASVSETPGPVSLQPSHLVPVVGQTHLFSALPIFSTSRPWPGLCHCLDHPHPITQHTRTHACTHVYVQAHTRCWCGRGPPLDRGSEGGAHEQCSFAPPQPGAWPRWSLVEGTVPSALPGRDTQHQQALGHVWWESWGLLPWH